MSALATPVPGARTTHLCLIRGMLIQLAAATAAKGTNRPTSGGRCWGRKGGSVALRIMGREELRMDMGWPLERVTGRKTMRKGFLRGQQW